MNHESGIGSRALTNILLICLIAAVIVSSLLAHRKTSDEQRRSTYNANQMLVSLRAIEEQTVKAPTTRWAYAITSPADDDLKAKLTEIGAAGWELVAARRATSEYSSSPSYEMIFKRPMPGIPDKP